MRLNFDSSFTRENELRAQAERAQAQLDEYYRQQERIASANARRAAFGEDDYEDRTVLFFRYMFANGTNVYDYTALKCGESWYLSGPRRPGPLSWTALVDFWISGDLLELWWVSEYRPIEIPS